MKRLMRFIMGFYLLLSIVSCGLAQPDQIARTLLSTPTPKGCLTAINDSHMHQWAETGSSSYVIKSSENDLSIFAGTYLITVNDGKITSVEVLEARGPEYVGPADFPSFEPLTIEGMFKSIGESANGYRGLTCFSTYDPKYGYPIRVQIYGLCTDCVTSITATLMSLSPSSTKEP